MAAALLSVRPLLSARQAELEHLLCCLSGRSSGGPVMMTQQQQQGATVWSDATMAIVAAILGCQPPIADASLLCVLERVDEEAATQQHPPSAKLVAVVNTLLGKYRQRLAPHTALLQRVAAKLNHPLIRTAVAGLAVRE